MAKIIKISQGGQIHEEGQIGGQDETQNKGQIWRGHILS